MLFVIQGLDIVDCNRNQRADRTRQFILPLHKHSIFKSGGAVCNRTVSISAKADHIARVAKFCHCVFPHFPNARQIGTRDNGTCGVNDTNCAVNCIFHLQDNRLEQSGGHFRHLSFQVFFSSRASLFLYSIWQAADKIHHVAQETNLISRHLLKL